MKRKQEYRTVQGKQRKFEYILTRKSVKNLNMRIKPTGEILISANRLVPVKYIDNFVLSQEEKLVKILAKYEKMQKPLIIATTAFTSEDIEKINLLAQKVPVFMTGNFSVALHDFIETIMFYARKISLDTDIQIVEYHHNQKKDAPSGTALMIKDALLKANTSIDGDRVAISSIRGGNIFGEHEVIFANCKDEVVTFKHQVSSREPFADGAIEVSKWLINQNNGLYNMDDFCRE